MNIVRKSFVALAVTCGAAWLTKMAVIAADGGPDADAAMIGILWTVGMLTFLLSAATGAALLARRAPTWLRVVVAVAAVPVAFLALNVLDAAIKAVYESEGWFRDEMSLVAGGVAMAAAGLHVLRHGGEHVRRA